MRLFVVFATLFLASTCTASLYGAVSSQYVSQDPHGGYSYGYSDPNSQKHESRSADGVTHGGYSYVDGHGHVQSVSYTADPHHGFHVSGTNLPQGPVAVHAAPWAHAAYAAPYAHGHSPVALTAHGVPADTPEVAAAKVAHFAAHAAAGHHHWKRSVWGGHGYAAPWNYAHTPVIHNGVPVDTPEVQHAKAAHFAAHGAALAHAAPYAGHYGSGAPVDTPEVAHAKAEHFAAHAAAGHPIAGGHHHGGIHIPVIHNGVPVDTPEVQHAKAAHFAAVAEAGGHGHDDGHYNSHDDGQYHGHDDGHYDGRYDGHHDGGHYGGHHGAIHIPVIHNGVPVETPEVQHAKAAHFAAVAQASHGSYNHGHHDDGSYHHHGW